MDSRVFEEISEIVYEHAGIRIDSEKREMVARRLGRRCRELELPGEVEYLSHLREDFERELVSLLDVISTNLTHFFRGEEHFEFARECLGGWMAEGQTRFRLWSAASSTGEEPYSLGMVLADAIEGSGSRIDAKILATDISTTVLQIARNGEYSVESVEPIPAPLKKKYLQRARTGDGTRCRVKEAVKDLITFKRLNLSKPPFPMSGPLDLVFCRNVMFYFDDPVRLRLIREIHRLLRPEGYFFVGLSESLTGISEMSTMFERVGNSTYRKVGDSGS